MSNIDLNTVTADSFGRSLRGIGLNLLVHNVPCSVAFLRQVFDAEIFQPTDDFSIVSIGGSILQLHADHTYHSHLLPSLLPEIGPRGGEIEIRLYEVDPDISVDKAAAAGATILAPAADKPHGLREAYILDPDGYAWVPSSRLPSAE